MSESATEDPEASRPDSTTVDPVIDADANPGANTSLASYRPTTTYNMPASGIRVTWWRLLNSAVILVFGVAKSVKAFQGSAIISNAFDIVLGLFWVLMYVYQLLFSTSTWL